MLTFGIPPEFRGGVQSTYCFKPACAIGSVPSLSGHAIAYRCRSLPRVRRHRASKPQGSSKRVLPWQVTMDQIICAALSHSMYYMVITYSRVWIDRVRLPISCSWSAEQGNNRIIPCLRSRLRIWPRGTDSPVPSRVSPLLLYKMNLIGWCLLAGFLPISAASSIYLYRPPPSDHQQTRIYQLTQLLTDDVRVRRHRVSSPQGSSSNGCLLPLHHHGLINVRLSFLTPTIIGVKWGIILCDTERIRGFLIRSFVELYSYRLQARGLAGKPGLIIILRAY